MSFRTAGHCFYCDRGMGPLGPAWQKKTDRTVTTDHVFSKKSKVRFGPLNTVFACNQCNNLKGHLDPRDFLVIMPSPIGASRLAERLIELGVAAEEVDDALSRRKKPKPVTVAPVMKHG